MSYINTSSQDSFRVERFFAFLVYHSQIYCKQLSSTPLTWLNNNNDNYNGALIMIMMLIDGNKHDDVNENDKNDDENNDDYVKL